MATFLLGDYVTAHYKTGKYIGEIAEDRGHVYVVKVLAVLKHPQQGDLHNPGQTENVFFHQRKALSFSEKANVSKSVVKPFNGDIPDYQQSLKQAVDQLKNKLQKDNAFNQKATRQLEQLEQQYFG
ncbi:kinase-associated lipoprotein B [Pontibacillus litoralis]|uniref:Kinase n=1 Tax=Pontibacillus litoralis JSM 072002 TaxID=1385512 RepID=A0A0A5G3U6_9BACI|nr:kinase-associated lipoprotein B [Pontibacillus litoralis]KGX86724.1 kinase [Pontibacillus litoralis JSM 072002]